MSVVDWKFRTKLNQHEAITTNTYLLTMNSTVAAVPPVDMLTGQAAAGDHQGTKRQPWREFIEIPSTKGQLFTFDHDKKSEDGNIRLLAELDDKGAGG